MNQSEYSRCERTERNRHVVKRTNLGAPLISARQIQHTLTELLIACKHNLINNYVEVPVDNSHCNSARCCWQVKLSTDVYTTKRCIVTIATNEMFPLPSKFINQVDSISTNFIPFCTTLLHIVNASRKFSKQDVKWSVSWIYGTRVHKVGFIEGFIDCHYTFRWFSQYC